MSLCSALDSQLEEFLLSNSLNPPGSGLGLNLSTNNGLDLTCPSYEEGLNLSQQSNTGQGQYNYNESVVLNLTQDHQHLQQGNVRHVGLHNIQQPQQQQQQYQSYNSLEVGLNLSLQKSYANQTQQQNGFYGQYDNSASAYGYTISNSNQVDQQRNSPLNLEQRSSPLNLTSVQVSGVNNSSRQKCQSFHYQTDFGYPVDGGATYQQQNNYSYYGNSIQQTQTNETAIYDQQTLQFDTGQFFVESNDMMAATSQPVNPSQGHAGPKIRLFCSSCCTEFSTTADLNRHMERHQMEAAMNVLHNGMQQQPQQQQPNGLPVSSQRCSNQQNESSMTSKQHASVLPHWADSFPTTTSSSSLQMSDTSMSMSAPRLMVEPPEINTCALDTTRNPMVQQLQLKPTATNPMPSAINRKVTPKLLPSTQNSAVPLEMLNNSTKKLNEPLEMCTDCNLVFPTGLDLRKHIDLAHKGRHGKTFQCSQCAKEFDDKSLLKTHIDQHEQEKQFSCNKCGLHLSNLASLKKHLKRVHEKFKQQHYCQQCGKGFYERHDLARHEKIHLAPKCSKCNKAVGTSGKHLCKPKANKDIPENEELKCKICSAQLETKVSWGYHMWKHTKDPSYIQSADAIQSTKPEETISQPLKPDIPSPLLLTSDKDFKPMVAQPETIPQQSKPLPPISTLNDIARGPKLHEPDMYPRAPEAHATSYTQLSQPLCLQTSRLREEEPIKPLNMQVILNVNQ